MRLLRHVFVFAFVLVSASVFSAPDRGRDYWLARYLSVSYPLRHITVNSAYGRRKDPVTGEVSSHSGLDLAASYEDVYAMFDGIVERIGSDKRSGNYVVIRHGIYTVSYCHLSRRYVEEGEEVTAGIPIAVSGCTGRATGAHLHLTVKKGDERTDPALLLSFIEAVRKECVAALGGIPGMLEKPSMNKRDFIRSYAPLARRQQDLYGIPASVTLAQMAHESRWGQSVLARSGNNYFGIKATRKWLADGKPYSVHDDDRKGEKFCNYRTVEESIDHHSRLLMSDRYKRCRSCKPTDYHGWLCALKAAGYATDRDYVSCCESIIKTYRLFEYDREAGKV